MTDAAARIEQLCAQLRQARDEIASLGGEKATLVNEAKHREHALAEALEQQTATAEILRVIASSPMDLTGVLDSIIRSAAQLTDADFSTIMQAEGDVVRVKASLNPEMVRVGYEQPFDRGSVNGRVLLDGVTIHEFSPAAEHLATYPNSGAVAQGLQVQLVTPLLRKGVPIGTLLVARRAWLPFTPEQVALLETFADQAVIAIENARLFEELETRTRELARSVEELRALPRLSPPDDVAANPSR